MLAMIENVRKFFAQQKVISVIQFFLVVVIASFSAICTYKIAMATFNSKLIAWMIMIIVEGSLTLFSYKFHKHSKFYVLIWIPYLAVSIIFSQFAIIRDANNKIYDNVHNSVEYKKYEADITLIDNDIAINQNKLNSINSNNPTEINDINKRIAEKRTKLTNTVSTPKTQRVRADLQKEIDSLEKTRNQLSTSQSSTSKEIESIRDSIKSANERKKELKQNLEKDLDKFNISNNVFKMSLFGFGISETSFWTLFFILAELTRFILLNDSKKNQSIRNNPPSDKKPIPELEQKNQEKLDLKRLKLALSDNVVSIASKGCKDSEKAQDNDVHDFSRNDVTEYLLAMYSTTNSNESIGYGSIAKEINRRRKEEGRTDMLTKTKAYKIKCHLEHLGIVKSDGNTKILVDKSKALLAIKKKGA